VLSHASDNITSQNIGGTDAWAAPHLRPWLSRKEINKTDKILVGSKINRINGVNDSMAVSV